MEFVKPLYAGFNAREIESVLGMLHDNVVWANGMQGGYVHGRDAVRHYWTQQWTSIDPRVEPVEISVGPDGEVVVEVHQVVRDLTGNLLADKMVGHVSGSRMGS